MVEQHGAHGAHTGLELRLALGLGLGLGLARRSTARRSMTLGPPLFDVREMAAGPANAAPPSSGWPCSGSPGRSPHRPSRSQRRAPARSSGMLQCVRLCAHQHTCTVLMHHASHLIPRPRVSTALKLHSAREDQAARWGTVLHSHLDHRHACENEASGVRRSSVSRAVSAAMFEGASSGRWMSSAAAAARRSQARRRARPAHDAGYTRGPRRPAAHASAPPTAIAARCDYCRNRSMALDITMLSRCLSRSLRGAQTQC